MPPDGSSTEIGSTISYKSLFLLDNLLLAKYRQKQEILHLKELKKLSFPIFAALITTIKRHNELVCTNVCMVATLGHAADNPGIPRSACRTG